ncbi:2-dehydro-3-deoxygalactonokinase [Noviherbaspirillum sp. ST9]|uniref:2-dehydro-3-deoxygalactonokinase n=1 Tax=Noviherbaspirillum sp. ST9 TaxID=3401606 RepID=UPI003B586F5A
MTGQSTTLLGIDWGTSNRRAYVLDERGGLIRQHEDGCGILNVSEGFDASLRALLDALEIDRADVIMSGMVGSRNGWQEAPYLAVDHPLVRLADAMMTVKASIPGTRVRVVPGYRYIDPHGLPDVMRGEEVQVLGALELGAAGSWFLLPGTHSKWVHIDNGRITEFMTFMTGELYALMSQHGTLSKVISSQDAVQDAFAAGLRAARQGGFTHTAFCCRAMVVTDAMPASHAASYLSGLLIGTELFEIVKKAGDAISAPVQVIGSPALSSRYLSALELLGIPARAWQPDGVYLAALGALFNIRR